MFHTNDIHGRVNGIARLATMLERARAEADAPVLYLDAGDVEETRNRLSNLTKGVAMHRLLRVAGCDAVAVGNGIVLRYGIGPLLDQTRAAGYPQLAANLLLDGRTVPGCEASTLLYADGIRVGVVGLSPADWPDMYEGVFGLEIPDAATVVRAEAATLRQAGAEVVIVLSHLGLPPDRELAAQLDGDVDLIVGAHTHHLLPDGEEVDGVAIVQAGEFGEHLGRVELEVDGDGARVVDVQVEPVALATPQHPAVDDEVAAIEAELEAHLAEVVGELLGPLELRDDAECSAANFMADVVRERMQAEVGVMTSGAAFDDGLPAGPLTRGALYEACSSPGNPGAANLTGAQLVQLVARGLDPELAQDSPRSFRGAKRGLMHLSGGEVREGRLLVGGAEVVPDRTYLVAGSDWELDSFGGYADEAWGLDVRYALPTTIMREAIEDRLRDRPQVIPPEARVHSPLDA